MEPKPEYHFAEIEAKWQQARSEKAPKAPVEPSADALKPLVIFPWPAGGSCPSGAEREATLCRRLLIGDTFTRFQRHRAQGPFFPLAIDGFSPAVLLKAREAGELPDDVVKAEREKVLKLERALGIEIESAAPPPAQPTGGREGAEAAGLVLTSDPAYYRFTQWIFLQLFLAGFVYRSERRFDLCLRCGRKHRSGMQAVCRSCQGELAAREAREWRVDITRYGDRLLSDLDKVNCLEEEKDKQCQALGRGRGYEVVFPASKTFDTEYEGITVFTTRVETIFGATFLLLDPYHPVLEHVLDPAYEDDVARYRDRLKKGMEPRISAARTGGFALNPANLRRIPILVSPLANGPFTDGAVMAVPGHDPDLFELAKRQKLPIREVIHNDKAKFDSHTQLEEPWLGDGVLTNSGPFTSMPVKVGRERIVQLLSRKGVCEKVSRFRLKNLRLSSELAWGPPVPLVHCKRCGVVPVPEGELPVELPPLTQGILKTEALKTEAFTKESTKADKPAEAGQLARLPEFTRATCPSCGEMARRDGETLLPWLGNAWAYLRLLCHELAGSVDGFRDLSWKPGMPGKKEPSAAATTPPSQVPSIESSSPREARGPTAAAPAESAAAPAPVPAPGDDGPGTGEPSSNPVLPEDVDIFSVPAGKLEGSEWKEEDYELDGEGQLEGGKEATPPPEGSTAEPAPDRLFKGGKGGEEPGRAGEEDQSPSQGRGEGEEPVIKEGLPDVDGESEDSEDEDEDESTEESAQFARVSKLKPFRSPSLDALLPVDFALVDGSLEPKDLLAVRFLCKFLEDLGELLVSEPFLRYHRVGEVTAPREKALDAVEKPRPQAAGPGPVPSQSAQQSPLGLLKPPRESSSEALWSSGADALRLYLLFSGPGEGAVPFDPRGPKRMRRFLERIWYQMNLRREKGKFVSRRMLVQKHFLIHDVTQRLLRAKFHTAVAALMRFVRFLEHPETTPEDMDRNAMKTFIILLSPFAPHLAAELWSRMGEEQDLSTAPWPVASDELIHPPEREFLILVNGKLRDRMQQPSTLEPEKLESRALQRDRIREIIGMKKVQKVVVVPQKLVSIVLAP